ncbi:MAG: VCBS repeat-containing protein [Pirellulaceae bacterium]
METTRNGDHLWEYRVQLEIPVLAIKVNTKVSVKDLARIPVLGLFRDGTWLLDTNHDGHPDESIEFGNPADQPLAGDFDGDGIAELAVVRRNPDGKFDLHIRFLSDAGEQFRVRELKVSTGQIVVGDYDGDERCDVAWVSHPSGAALLNWQIDINGDAQWDEDVSYGFPTDIPVMGDWNGDGRADVGTLRRSPGINAWLLNGIGLHGSYREIRYGLPHDLPIVADWNGDNRTDIGVYRSTQGIGTFLLDLDFDPASERFVHFGLPNDIPIAFMSGLRLPIKEPVSSK